MIGLTPEITEASVERVLAAMSGARLDHVVCVLGADAEEVRRGAVRKARGR